VANTGFKGIDVRQTGTALLFRAFLQDGASPIAKVTSGTTTYSLYELQSDGTLKSYDFSDNTFKTTALTTATAALTHRTGNNSTVNTGVWTAALATLTGFTVGALYLVQVNNSTAVPPDQTREFQYGSAEGDLATTANGTGVAGVQSDTQMWKGTALPAQATSGVPDINVKNIGNAASAGAAGYVGIDWSHVNAPTTAVGLTGTTISTGQVVASVSGGVGGSVTGTVGGINGVTFPSNFNLLSIDTNGATKIQALVKKNQALAGFTFYLALTSDHISPATGKTVTATRSLDGAAFQACANSVTELGSGWYVINLAATDLNANVVALSFAGGTGVDTTILTVLTQP
jgi:hypothetical protein